MVSDAHDARTPPATRRAETSFTGLGNENSACTLPRVLRVVTSLPMTCSLSRTG